MHKEFTPLHPVSLSLAVSNPHTQGFNFAFNVVQLKKQNKTVSLVLLKNVFQEVLCQLNGAHWKEDQYLARAVEV